MRVVRSNAHGIDGKRGIRYYKRAVRFTQCKRLPLKLLSTLSSLIHSQR